jgi:alkylated DNA repair protein (DNA oxidative demethylase)
MPDLFTSTTQTIAPGIVLLRDFAPSALLVDEIAALAVISPFRHMTTPSGKVMGAAMTNCGPLGWIGDSKGYRYAAEDPLTGNPWPSFPASFLALAHDASTAAGFEGFTPDACLINRYAVGVGMGMHRDQDEKDREAPIVSVSLGLPARFAIRADRGLLSLVLEDGDVIVFGGPARNAEHGLRPIPAGHHPRTGGYRFNLTFRKAG